MKTPIKLPDLEVLNDLLELKDDFTLWWKPRNEKYFIEGKRSKEIFIKAFNTQYAGKQALNELNNNGYPCGRILNKHYLAHRIIWKMIHGYDPDYIDHIDGNPLNNHIDNLRNVSFSENHKNKKKNTNNTSGFTGVFIDKRRPNYPYRAAITINGRTKHLGRYKTIEEAIEARKQGEIKFGYHKNHGRTNIN